MKRSRPGLLSLIVTAMILSQSIPLAVAWSNGGYSADPDNPDYGTHDWMAEHALDWLPAPEKEYIVDNMAKYLFGTEMPDLPAGQGGIGDTWYHHIYFYENGTLMPMEDDSAWRASTEYNDTKLLLQAEDYPEAAKNAGIMTHYIADVSVWAHVVGWPTRDWWGWEDQQVHSAYESRVRDETTSYTSAEWDPFLEFDGKLDVIDAYNATIDVAYNATFGDQNGDFNCTWMNVTASQPGSTEWSDTDFVNRTGVLLNIAVNAITDVLHTLALDSGYASGQVRKHQVKVNEFEQNPPGNDIGNEWVELYNPTNETADLSYWYLENGDSDRWPFPNGTSLPADNYTVITFPTQWLDNVNESVGLYTPYGHEVDITPREWDEENDDRTWSRLPNGVDTNSSTDWTFQDSTQNLTNDPPPPPPNTPPVPIFIIDPSEGDNTTEFTFNATPSNDPDGDTLSFEWAWDDGTTNSTGIIVNHKFAVPGLYNITLTVNDNNGSINTTDQTLNVTEPPPPPDDPPVVNSLIASPAEPTFQDNINLAANVSDDWGISNVTFHYQVVNRTTPGPWLSLLADTAPYEVDLGHFPKNATVNYHITVTDSAAQWTRYPVSGNLSINVTPNIRPIALLSVDMTTAFVNETVTLSANLSSDPDGTIIEYMFDLGDCCLSGWISDDNIAHNYTEPGTYNATVTVRDNDLDLTISEQVVVQIEPLPPPNNMPTIRITDIPDNVTVNETLDLLLEIEDLDGDQLTVVLSEAPDGMAITTSNNLMWVPRADQVGDHTIVIEVSDHESMTIYDFTITVIPPSVPPPPPPPPKKEDDLSWLWFSLLAAVVIAAILGTAAYHMMRKRSSFSIEDIFIVHDSGRLIAHVAKEMRPEAMDTDVVSSMLMAVQDFVRESMEMDGSLEVLKHGDKTLLIEKAEHHFTALVVLGEPPSDLRSRVKSLNWTIEEKYGEVLTDWDGALSDLKGVKKHLLPLIERYRG